MAIDSYGASATYQAPGYTTVDVNLERKLSPVTAVLLTVRNLFDREHLEVTDPNVGTLGSNKGVFWGRESYLSFRFDL